MPYTHMWSSVAYVGVYTPDPTHTPAAIPYPAPRPNLNPSTLTLTLQPNYPNCYVGVPHATLLHVIRLSPILMVHIRPSDHTIHPYMVI